MLEAIQDQQPDLVFAPHVETSSGVKLPDDYIRRLAEAIHDQNGLLVLDCIASGTDWVDMQDTGVDILISAPQKGWSGSPCCAMVMMSRLARDIIEETESSSFACDLKKWLSIMETYEAGGHAYHATLPTDALRTLRDAVAEAEGYGLQRLQDEQLELGRRARELLAEHGYRSVAAPGFEAAGVVVSYTSDPDLAVKFAAGGLQVATGVPLMCNEGDDFRTFRIGLFGFDKLHSLERTLSALEQAMTRIETTDE